MGAAPGTGGSISFHLPEFTSISEVETRPLEVETRPLEGLDCASSEHPRGGTQDQTAEAEHRAGVSEDTVHLQDALPSVGAAPGTVCSSSFPLPELTSISEGDTQPLEVETRPLEGLDSVVLQRREGIPGEKEHNKAGRLEGLGEGTQSQRAEAQKASEATSHLESLTVDTEEESEEDDIEQERKMDDCTDKQTVEEVPKHRRTYCRNTSCVNCKVPCGKCCDCTSSNTKTGC